MKRLPRWMFGMSAALTIGAVAAVALTPVKYDSPEELFEIPKGTWARRMAGNKIEILPLEIRLVLGIHNILCLRNLDVVPQIFGPTLIMPGQSFRLPFEVASEYQFACTAHLSGQMTIIVDEEPKSPWARLRWRTTRILKTASLL
jgi:hypothetical protein